MGKILPQRRGGAAEDAEIGFPLRRCAVAGEDNVNGGTCLLRLLYC